MKIAMYLLVGLIRKKRYKADSFVKSIRIHFLLERPKSFEGSSIALKGGGGKRDYFGFLNGQKRSK
ncbi:hypothetical protein MFLO_09322 [Listeria floridensis FSL S10-1187]|uniref:Uncharacterized protein n=1 Tax=Listeria floridensis FSL S10-1187 TaxID=1265817 RepID=A0ABN0REQ2_9LIST|nr:hypothetical protein MFLO_09322 [Listeria floridensis FSL S10-1187]